MAKFEKSNPDGKSLVYDWYSLRTGLSGFSADAKLVMSNGITFNTETGERYWNGVCDSIDYTPDKQFCVSIVPVQRKAIIWDVINRIPALTIEFDEHGDYSNPNLQLTSIIDNNHIFIVSNTHEPYAIVDFKARKIKASLGIQASQQNWPIILSQNIVSIKSQNDSQVVNILTGETTQTEELIIAINDEYTISESGKLYSRIDKKLVGSIPYTGGFRSFVFSPDSRYIITTGGNGTIAYNIANKTSVQIYPRFASRFYLPVNLHYLYKGHTFSEDGKYIYILDSDTLVVLGPIVGEIVGLLPVFKRISLAYDTTRVQGVSKGNIDALRSERDKLLQKIEVPSSQDSVQRLEKRIRSLEEVINSHVVGPISNYSDDY